MTKTKAEPDEEEEHNEIDEIVTRTFASVDRGIEELKKIPQTAKKKTGALLKLFDGDVFDKPSTFLTCITDLSEEIGHANHVVLEIDLRRQGLSRNEQQAPVAPISSGGDKTNLIVQTQPPKGGGFFDYLGTRRMSGVWKQYLESQKNEPQITTSKEATDVLNYGRQLLAESNKTDRYYEQSLAHLKIFSDKETKERFSNNLREHMNKISGIIRAFCRTAVEYRTEIAGERKERMAEAVLALKMAQMQGPGLTVAEAYRAARVAMGPQDAGR